MVLIDVIDLITAIIDMSLSVNHIAFANSSISHSFGVCIMRSAD